MSREDDFDYLPYFAEGEVIKGFGRGGAELGIPTANFPSSVISKLPKEFMCGVYYGWACVNTLTPPTVYKMVMCVGWNSHFHNTIKTMETHILHKFDHQFYGENLRIIITGYIRPMRAYKSLDALIQAMNEDISYADTTLDQHSMLELSRHPFLTKDTTSQLATIDVTSGNSINGCCLSSNNNHKDEISSTLLLNRHMDSSVSVSKEIQNQTSSSSFIPVGEKKNVANSCHVSPYNSSSDKSGNDNKNSNSNNSDDKINCDFVYSVDSNKIEIKNLAPAFPSLQPSSSLSISSSVLEQETNSEKPIFLSS